MPGHFHGAEFELRKFGGAVIDRIVHPGAQSIGEHAHDWPVLSLYRLGCYHERGEAGERRLDGPSAVFHAPGSAHADEIDDRGLETVTLTFDVRWLKGALLPDGGSRYWSGGAVGPAIARLMALWQDPATPEPHLRAATRQFLDLAAAQRRMPHPAWLQAFDAEPGISTEALASRLDLHPAWLARAYRAARGEGLHDTRRRRQVERAVQALRRTADPLADIALASGFCDQSHMNRALRQVLGQTPLQVRQEAALLA